MGCCAEHAASLSMRVEAQLHTRHAFPLGSTYPGISTATSTASASSQLGAKYHLLLLYYRTKPRLPIMSKMWEVDPETRSKVRCALYYRVEWGARGQLRSASSTDDGLCIQVEQRLINSTRSCWRYRRLTTTTNASTAMRRVRNGYAIALPPAPHAITDYTY